MMALAEVQPTRTLDQYERAALRRDLWRWGDWESRRRLFSGYPKQDNVAAYNDGAGGGIQGHRILCMDMPPDVWAVNARVRRLPDELFKAVEAFFVCVVSESGTILSERLRAESIGVSERTMRRRVSMAMLKIAGIEE